MTVPTSIQGAPIGDSRVNTAGVTQVGALCVAPVSYDESQFLELDTDNVAFNFYPPVVHKQFVVTAIRIKANRDVSNTVDASVVIYEAVSPTTTTEARVLHQDALIRGEGTDLVPLNLLANSGVYINAKTSDNSIFMTIFGYYIPVVD